ncbi:MAG: LacI family DNA-binding transcriptional regulator [Bacteroidales bacterium]
MEKKRKRNTIRDVAKLAGVSTTTVSFVYHEPERVKKETKKLVLDAAKQLNYIPSLSASALRGKSNLVAVIINFHIDDLHHPTVIEALPFISLYLKDAGYYMLPFFYNENDSVQELISLAETGQIAGALFMASKNNFQLLDFFIDHTIPLCLIGTIKQYEKKIFSIDNNNVADVAMLVETLYQLGYKKIAFISGDLSYIVCKQRLEGYMSAVLKYKKQDPLTFAFSDDRICIQQAVNQIIMIQNPPDAIITKDDIKGIYVIGELYKQGLTPGKDIGIASIGGVQAATYTYPQLSGMTFSIKEIARRAVQQLCKNISTATPAIGSYFVNSTFTDRESTPRQF